MVNRKTVPKKWLTAQAVTDLNGYGSQKSESG